MEKQMSHFRLSTEASSIQSVYDSYDEKRLLAALLSFISFTGVIGNSVVLLAPVLSRKPRTPTNVFVVNLAIADISMCLSMPVMILALLSENREKLNISEQLCAFQGFILVVCSGCSMNNIASIAVHRALITSRKNQSHLRWLFDRRCLAATVTTTWLIPLTVSLLPILSEFGAYEYDDKLSSCSFNPTAPGSGVFSKIMMVVFYPVQLLAVLVSSVYVGLRVKRHKERIGAAPPQQGLAVVGGAMRLPGRLGQHRQSRSSDQCTPNRRIRPLRLPFRRNIHVTLSLLLVVFFFVMCCAPYLITVAVLKDRINKFVPFLGLLLFSNSCINPVIYTARHPDFKHVCRCIMLCRLSKIPRKSSFLKRLLGFGE